LPVGTTPFMAATGSLAAGGSATFSLIVQVDSAAAAGTTISNSATVAAANDSNPANNIAIETTNVEQPGVLACEITTLNVPGDAGSATLGDDADNSGDGVLIVTGTSRSDVIIVEPRPGNRSQIRVTRNGQLLGTFSSSAVQHIVVFGLAGNDTILVNGTLRKSATLLGDEGNDFLFGGRGADGLDGGSGNDFLFGGSGDDTLCGGDGNDFVFGQSGNDLVGGDAGNDHLFGEAGNDQVLGGEGNDFLSGGTGNDRLFGQVGNDQLFGEAGNDILVGGDGNDLLFGGTGRDLLIGGNGADQLFGEAHDDILVAGSTSHDEDDEALRGILAEWTSSRSYSSRASNIRSGGGANGVFTLDDTTVSDDGASDTLFGGGGQDWFLFGTGDKVRDRARNERVN
jgi:Ca2+-binding RTX toxin-like protein